MRSRSRGPRISSARPADQTAQVSTRPSRRRRARVSRRLAPRGLVRTLASFRRDISSCTSGAPSNSRGNCAPAAVDDASGSASSLRPKPCRPAPTPRGVATIVSGYRGENSARDTPDTASARPPAARQTPALNGLPSRCPHRRLRGGRHTRFGAWREHGTVVALREDVEARLSGSGERHRKSFGSKRTFSASNSAVRASYG